MPYVPVTTVGDLGNGDPAIILSLELDAVRTVVGWQVINHTASGVAINLTTAKMNLTQTFPTGTHAGSIPNQNQWNYDQGSDTSYGIAVRWPA